MPEVEAAGARPLHVVFVSDSTGISAETMGNALKGVLGKPAARKVARLHGIGDAQRYNARMAAVEHTLEHDDGGSLRALDEADLILLAPARCGKTPTAMYLAPRHGIRVANSPLLEEDLESSRLPRPVQDLGARCWGMLTTPQRLAQVREQRRPASRYASMEQCRWELRQAEAMFHSHRIPTVDSSAKSVEEMSTVILQRLTEPDARTEERAGTRR